MTFKGGISAACAACKHQRRGCKPDCPLAPYFPADEEENFQRVHKLFGVKKILNTLESLDDDDIKSNAINAMIFEAYMRHNDPIRGSYGLIMHLKEKIKLYKEELHAVLQQLAMYGQNPCFDASKLLDNVVPSQIEFGMVSMPVDVGSSQVEVHMKSLQDDPSLRQQDIGMEPTQDDIMRPQLMSIDDVALWNNENVEDYYAGNAAFIPTQDDAWLAPPDFHTAPMLEDITRPQLMPVDDVAIWNNENAEDYYAGNATFIPTQGDMWLAPPDFDTVPTLEDITHLQLMPDDNAALWNNENAEDYYTSNATFIPMQDDASLMPLDFDMVPMSEDVIPSRLLPIDDAALWNTENAKDYYVGNATLPYISAAYT